MVFLILSPELKFRYEQLASPVALVASAGVVSMGALNDPTGVSGASTSSVAAFSNFFRKIKTKQNDSLAVNSLSSDGVTSAHPQKNPLLIINWKVPLPSEALSHAVNVESLLDTLTPSAGGSTSLSYGGGGRLSSPRRGGGSFSHGADTLGMPIGNALHTSSSQTHNLFIAPESLYLFLYDIERGSILKPIDPSFSAEELKLSNSSIHAMTASTAAASSFSPYHTHAVNSASSVVGDGAFSGPLSNVSSPMTGRFGILATTHIGPSLEFYFGPVGVGNRLSSSGGGGGGDPPDAYTSGKGNAFNPTRPQSLTAAAHFVKCGTALQITGLRKQRVRKEGVGGRRVGGDEIGKGSPGMNPWSGDSLAYCEMSGGATGGDGGGGGVGELDLSVVGGAPSLGQANDSTRARSSLLSARNSKAANGLLSSVGREGGGGGGWYDGISSKPAIVTFRVSKFFPAGGAARAQHSNMSATIPSVLVGLMNRDTAAMFITKSVREGKHSNSNNNNNGEGDLADGSGAMVDSSAPTSSSSDGGRSDPHKLPLPIPYILQLLFSEEDYKSREKGQRVGDFFVGTSLGEKKNSNSGGGIVPTCMMMDVTTGSLITAPFVIMPAPTSGSSSEASDGSGQQQQQQNVTIPTTPAVYAVDDRASYYPHCPSVTTGGGSSADASCTATPITFQLIPPDPVGILGPNQPPVAVLQVISQGEVLHKYAFVASRRQLKDLVPVVQINTPNTIVDVE